MRELTEREVAPLWDKLAERLIPIAVWRHQESEGKAIEIAFANAILSTFWGVSEVDARDRERCAYALGHMDSAERKDLDEGLRRRYPLRCRVMLSTGMWQYCGVPDKAWYGVRASDGALSAVAHTTPMCLTPEDYEAVAALLREEQGR